MTSIAFRRSLKLTADALQLMRTGSTLEKPCQLRALRPGLKKKQPFSPCFTPVPAAPTCVKP